MCCSRFPSCKVHPETLPWSLYKHSHSFPLFSFSSGLWRGIYKTRGVLSTRSIPDCQGKGVFNRTLTFSRYQFTFMSKNENIRVANFTISKTTQQLILRKTFWKGWDESFQLIQFRADRLPPKGRAGIVNRRLGDAFQQILCSREFQLLSGLEKSHSHFLNAGT